MEYKNGEITKSKLAEHSWNEKPKYNVAGLKYYAKPKTKKEMVSINTVEWVISQPSIDVNTVYLPLL
jgi:hypothetical protein